MSTKTKYAASPIYVQPFQLMSKLYLDTAEGLWNGNKLKGKDAIIKFFEDLPTSEHKLESLDAQPVAGNDFGLYIIFMLVIQKVSYLYEHCLNSSLLISFIVDQNVT